MSVNDTPARHPNRFLADLTQAMRTTAETARQGTIEQAQADAKTYVERLRASTEDEAAALRNSAETDVAAIRDWSKAEMERIRVETEHRVSRRRELLDQELHEYNSAIELEVQRVDKRVQSFEEEVAQFFEQLLQEADPTIFASMAALMPDPPAFTEIANGALTTELRARREQIMRTDVALPEFETIGSNGSHSDAKQAADNVDGGARHGAAAPKSAGRESTQVVVVGLVSVASIATFKRQLGRLPGVKNVGVSSGPDGEFIFTIGHSADTSLSTLIPTLPAFQARVVNEHDGVLNVSAHDPEAEG
jgi:phage-related minor tail protein